MKKRHFIICGSCYVAYKDALKMRILGGFNGQDKCAFCFKPVNTNAYIVEVGDDEEEDNTRRPANFTKKVP